MCTSLSHERIGPTSLDEFAVNITVKRSTSHNGVFANGSLLSSEYGRQTKVKLSQSVRSEGMHVQHQESRHNDSELMKKVFRTDFADISALKKGPRTPSLSTKT